MRAAFEFPAKLKSWFPGHMAKAMRELRERILIPNRKRLAKVDGIIEVRDSRLPFSSIHPFFTDLTRGKQHFIVYNKIDLSSPSIKRTVVQALKTHSALLREDSVTFLNAHKPDDVNQFLKKTLSLLEKQWKDRVHQIQRTATTDRLVPFSKIPPTYRLMVIGMPNVGKSTLINQLRRFGVGKGKAAHTGKLPGVTRCISNVIQISDSPCVYLTDSPGIMLPSVTDPEIGLKLALTNMMKDAQLDEILLVDFLLFRMNEMKNTEYVRLFKLESPTDDVYEFLAVVARHIGAAAKTTQQMDFHHAAIQGDTSDSVNFSQLFTYDYPLAAKFVVQKYRDGYFGSFSLDDVSLAGAELFFQKRELLLKEANDLASGLT